MTARSALLPRDPAQGVALVYPPWIAPAEALTRTVEAGARFVRFGGLGFVTIAMPDDRGYSARAAAGGAWLVLDPRFVAACLPWLGAGASKP